MNQRHANPLVLINLRVIVTVHDQVALVGGDGFYSVRLLVS